jgi:hypothetical protein
MQLWILRPVDEAGPPWTPWPESCTFGFVVRARSEVAARAMAAVQAGGEGTAWLNATLSTCEELIAAGPEGIVMIDATGAK